jgi:hypothetical protein
MKPDQNLLRQIFQKNPHIIAAWFDNPLAPTTLHITRNAASIAHHLSLPNINPRIQIQFHESDLLRTLRVPATRAEPQNINQECQNEPISLGTQIQPAGAEWLGTAGSPVSWIAADRTRHWGFLSNWHVLADGDQRIGRPAHQPDTGRPAIGTLAAWHEVNANTEHLIDAAIADALVDGFHTITNRILEIGQIGPNPITATVGLAVAKAGRTTGQTLGQCIGVGAMVRVGYDDFTATLIDQDVFQGADEPFSAPGDSGSLIVGASCRCPASLLFAGNSALTIGNPIRHVTKAFNLVFPFN